MAALLYNQKQSREAVINVYQKVLRFQACEIEERYGPIWQTNGMNNFFLKFIQRKNDRRMKISINLSQEILAIDVFTALNFCLQHSHKHIL